jgi:uncharacterized membrane protein
MPTTRLEAFSDGVIAIAITLLVLDIKVPDPGEGSLGHELAQQWPSYAAYVVSFLTIGVIWINHHATIARVRQANRPLLILNLLLLMAVAVLPFTTSLVATYLRESDGQHLAATIYAGSLLLMALTFMALQSYIVSPRAGIAHERIDADARRMVLRRNAIGLLPYAAAVAVAPLSSYASLAICGAVAIFYALPDPPGT